MSKETRLRALNNEIRRLDRRLENLQAASYRYSWLRIAAFGLGLLVSAAVLLVADAWLAALCLAVTLALFAVAVYAHRRVDTSIRRHRIWRQIKRGHVARAGLDWEHMPTTFPHHPRPGHPFEMDLDLVGLRSVHRLLDTAVSYEGSLRLRDWLTAPVPDLQAARERQQRVRELAPLHLFRDRLILNAMAATGAKKTWQANHLVAWLEEHSPESSLRLWLALSAILVLANAALVVANLVGLLPPWWQISAVLVLGLWLIRSRATEAAWDQARALQGALQQLHAVFRQLETFAGTCRQGGRPALAALCAPFVDARHRPSRYLGRASRLVAATGLRANPFVALALNLVLPWDAYLIYRLNQTKAGLARRVPGWMEVWFELEALGALASLAYLNPAYTFPRMAPAGEPEAGPVLRAVALGHPLLPDGERVCNDLVVPDLGQVAIITGSNMAGKSAFLKTVGANLALAYAGGPVNAGHLDVALFRLYTCMGISDSVTDGISYFYAEVKRLKALLAALEDDHPLPLLFCIDEIFRGTNNRERLAGSRAYVRALAGKHGVGFIATHDLELARLAEEMSQVENYHFRDTVTGGRMAFDYRLRPGPCPTTNALTIMQLEGLPVPPLDGEG